MLVLSARLQEAIVIDGNITVRVIEIDRGQVRLGISAPKSIPVHRESVQRAIEKRHVREAD